MNNVTDRTIETPSGCLEWTGYRAPTGYGTLSMNGRRGLYAHRVAWEQTRGPIPPGMSVCHTCDNPPCVNPDHLFLGTQADNLADAKAKGRARGPNYRGSQVGTSKLTEAEVAQIKGLLARGMAQPDIARAYGVSPDTVSLIHRGKTWRHVKAA